MVIVMVLVAVVACYFLFVHKKKAKQKPKAAAISITPVAREQTSGENFLEPIPAGFQIYAERMPIAGIHLRKSEALNFAKAKNQELKLQREPDNEHDSNAIKVIGISGPNEYFIGYLPKELSEQLVLTGLFDSVLARLARIYVGRDDFLDIQYQIVGPKSSKKQFDDFLNSQPADSLQKEYFKFFGLPISRGLTTTQADQMIFEHTKKCPADEVSEWEAYKNIVDEFEDKDFRESYELKKVSKTVLQDAIKQLKMEGKTYQYLESNIDELVAKILLLRPELERQR